MCTCYMCCLMYDPIGAKLEVEEIDVRVSTLLNKANRLGASTAST